MAEPVAERTEKKSLWEGVEGLLKLLRPLNVVLCAAGALLGGVLVAGADALQGERLGHMLWAAGAVALVSGAANSMNDACDLDIDRINRPDRPLPSGRVSLRGAWMVWAIGTTGGVILSAWLSWAHAVMAGGAAGLLYAYNARWKRLPGWGNGIVAFVVALPLVYGGWGMGAVPAALVGAAFAFLTTLAREIIKDVQDARGDQAGGGGTLALAWGRKAAWQSAAGLVVLTVALTPAPFLFLSYPGVYLIGVMLADGALLRVLSLCSHPPTPGRAGQASQLLKTAMALGMAALAVAGLSM